MPATELLTSKREDTSEKEKPLGLVVRRLADKSGAVQRYNHETRETETVNPLGKGKTWPIIGWMLQFGPKFVGIPMGVISKWITMGGFVTLENERVVQAPGAHRAQRPDGKHTFINCDAILLQTVDEGVVRYEVYRQPGKDAVTGDVSWVFNAQRVN